LSRLRYPEALCGRDGSPHRFNLKRNLDLFAHRDAAPIGWNIEGEAEIPLMDGGSRGKTGAQAAPWVLGAAEGFDLDGSFARDSADGEIAGQGVVLFGQLRPKLPGSR
jgi:hypothetical protein